MRSHAPCNDRWSAFTCVHRNSTIFWGSDFYTSHGRSRPFFADAVVLQGFKDGESARNKNKTDVAEKVTPEALLSELREAGSVSLI